MTGRRRLALVAALLALLLPGPVFGQDAAARRALPRRTAAAHKKILAAWLELASVARRLSHGASARAAYQEVLRVDPDHREAREKLGYVRQGREWVLDPDRAQRLGERDPPVEFLSPSIGRKFDGVRRKTHATVVREWTALGRWCEENGFVDEARAAYEPALRLRPEDETLEARLRALGPRTVEPAEDRPLELREVALSAALLGGDERGWGLLREIRDGDVLDLPGGRVRVTVGARRIELAPEGVPRRMPVRLKLTGGKAKLPKLGPDGADLEILLLVHPTFGTRFLVGANGLRADLDRTAIHLVDCDLDGDPGGEADAVVLAREGLVWALPRLRALPLPKTYDAIEPSDDRTRLTVRSRQRIPTAEQKEALVLLNLFRRTVGMAECAFDPELTRACEKHCRYMKLNGIRSGSGITHDEDPANPGFSEEGRRAAKNSSNSTEDDPADQAMRGTLATFYHRLMMIHPQTRRVGIAHAHGANVVDVYSGQDDSITYRWPAIHPAPGQVDVPHRLDDEWPNPVPGDEGHAGYPITIRLGTGEVKVDEVEAILRAGETVVPCAVSWPGEPASPRYPDNWSTIAIVPLEPLHGMTRYEVEVRYVRDGRRVEHRWHFFTGDRPAGSTWRRLK